MLTRQMLDNFLTEVAICAVTLQVFDRYTTRWPNTLHFLIVDVQSYASHEMRNYIFAVF